MLLQSVPQNEKRHRLGDVLFLFFYFQCNELGRVKWQVFAGFLLDSSDSGLRAHAASLGSGETRV
jgi:hypothetical protein